MKNFEFEHNGEKLWYSRSLACSLIVFVRKADGVYVLANKRGKGCEFNIGLWNLPGGFIDFDEDAIECVIRETWEECGVRIDRDRVKFYFLNTSPQSKRQTMIASHYAVYDDFEATYWTFSDAASEKDEVEEIKLIPVRDILKYDWCRGQKESILNCYRKIFIE